MKAAVYLPVGRLCPVCLIRGPSPGGARTGCAHASRAAVRPGVLSRPLLTGSEQLAWKEKVPCVVPSGRKSYL